MEQNNPILIVVDPGHGGYDNGAVYNDRLEKDDNLRLGLAVRDALENQGVKVIMTRDTDMVLPLSERVKIANQNNADLLVSLHRNSYPEHTADTNGVGNYIYLTAPEATSGKAAQLVLDAIADVGVQNSRGVRQSNYYVVRRARMPAMMLEMGYIIDNIDNQLFDKHLMAYAEAIAKGVMGYFELPYISDANQPYAASTVSKNNLPPMEPISNSDCPPSEEILPSVVTLPPSDITPHKENPAHFDAAIPPEKQKPLVAASPSKKPMPLIDTLPLGRTDMIIVAQQAMNASFGAKLDTDGVYGPKTKRSVVSILQQLLNDIRKVSLKVDGVYGSKTKAELFTLRKNSQGDMVKILQVLLHLHGYDCGVVDGIFSSRTKIALSMFQRDNFLIPDGIAGPNVLNHLFS